MVAALGFVLDGIMEIGSMVLWAGETAINGLLVAVVAAYTAIVALLPSMGDGPALGTPAWLGWLNWFYPVGLLVDGIGAAVTVWIAFLAYRYILRLTRGL